MIKTSIFVLASSLLSVSHGIGERVDRKMIEMRDGVKLHTVIAYPKDMKEGDKVTVIMDRSPYGADALELINDIYLPYGFITVGQDMRGTGQSQGNFTIWHADADDSEDTGNWLIQQPWSNGVVFTFGASADGLGAFTTVHNNPSWLGASYIVWSSSKLYECVFPNGAYLAALTDMWITSTVPDDADASLAIIEENEMRTEWWDALDVTGLYGNIRAKSNFWAGWYDIFLVGNLAAYEGYNEESDPSVYHESRLLVDPLGHCQDAEEYFTEDLVEGRTLLSLGMSLETFGVRPVYRSGILNVTFYVMSSNDDVGKDVGQYWTTLERFPTPTMVKYYFQPDYSLTTTIPSSEEASLSTSFLHDPSDPIPTQGGSNLELPCGPLDQSEVDKRADVIVFNTPVFTEELALTGPLFANLFVSSDCIDTDFMVRISDVYPTGEVRLLQDSAIRMRWREGGLTPVYMEKTEVYEVEMTLWNTSYVVAPGHGLRVSISSSNAPRFDINRNNGILLADQTPEDLNYTATNTIFHSAQYPSSVVLPVVDKATQLPEVHNIKEQIVKAYPEVNWDSVFGRSFKTMKKN